MSQSEYDNSIALSTILNRFKKNSKTSVTADDEPIGTLDDDNYITLNPSITYKNKTNLPYDDIDKYSFTNFERNPGNEEAFRNALCWEPDMDMGLFYFGEPGTGKTHLLKAIARKYAFTSTPIRFVESLELIKEIFSPLHDTPGRALTDNIINKYSKNFGLIIDDIQLFKSSDYQNNILKELIEKRNECGLITFMGCDLDAQSISDIFHPRVLDRIKQGCRPIALKSPSGRQKIADNKIKAIDAKIRTASIESLLKEDQERLLWPK